MKGDSLRLAPYAYLFGLAALMVTGAWYVVNRQLDTYGRVGLALSVLGVAAGVLLDPQRVRQALTGRQARYGSNALVMSLAFIGILSVVNYLAYKNPARWDLTEDKQYSLAPETVLVLTELSTPVTIKGFYTPELVRSRDNIRPLLDQYKLESGGKVGYEFVDPLKNPLEADRYGVTRDGSLVVVVGDASEVLAFASEREITSALVRLANPGERKVYFLGGHGERDLEDAGDSGYSRLREALEAKNYEVANLNLLVQPKIPEGALAVIVAGPRVPLSADEVDLLEAYLSGGGALVVLQEPRVALRSGDAPDPLAAYLD
jgi:hypothetical protein